MQSFDSEGYVNGHQYEKAKLQRSMQQPESLRPTPYYVVCSSNPKTRTGENLLHMSQPKTKQGYWINLTVIIGNQNEKLTGL